MSGKVFIDACYRRNTPHVPVWFMRQAGRIFPRYRQIRRRYGILEICKKPEVATEVALMPVHELGVDAAILFADIMIPLLEMGVRLRIVDGVGPVIAHPVKTGNDVRKLRTPRPESAYGYIGRTIELLRRDLPSSVALIGFSGAPFTLASYLIEGRPTREFLRVKTMMYSRARDWHALMSRLTSEVIRYLEYQIERGAEAVQLFDSWVGCLDERDYREYVLPYSKKIFSALRGRGVPRIHFGTGTAAFLSDFSSVDAEVIGLDWRVPLKGARAQIGRKALQGNIDPAALLGPTSIVRKKVDAIFSSIGERRGFIFNTGHGILPETRVETLRSLVRYVHSK